MICQGVQVLAEMASIGFNGCDLPGVIKMDCEV